MLNSEAQGSLAFGRWLRQRRKARDLTQEKLAEQVGCALETIRKIESGRRRPSRQMAELLATAVGVRTEELLAVVDLARVVGEPEQSDIEAFQNGVDSAASRLGRGNSSQQRASLAVAGGLPFPRTELVGRSREREAISSLLQREDVRLLTLHGPPGIGKTRLAIHAGHEMAASFPDGVFYISLSEITDPDLVMPAISSALQLSEQPNRPFADVVKDYLHNKRSLLVLDNFEQVIRSAPLLSNLLTTCQWLKVLVTSRWVLRTEGEFEVRVPPLTLPHLKGNLSREKLEQIEAIQLFVQRAADVDTSFHLTDENAPFIAEICRRLDALPLTIELAAAWCKVLTPGGIVARLDDGFNLPATGPLDIPARQQTLNGAIAWSYELLSPQEARLFRRMAVFSGGAGVEAIEAVCSDPAEDDVLKLVLALLDANLLHRVDDRNGNSRFAMLTTIRKYATDRLNDSGEARLIRERHAAYYLDMATVSESEIASGRRAAWLSKLEAEHDNLRAALAWAIEVASDQTSEQREEQALARLRMVAALGWFWYFRGHFTEGRRWVELAIAASNESARQATPEEIHLRAGALNAMARLAWCQNDYLEVRRAASQVLEIVREPGGQETVEEAHALTLLGIAMVRQNDLEGGYPLLEQGVALFRQAGEEWGLAFGLDRLADATTWREDYERAAHLYQESFGLFRGLNDTAGMAAELRELGNVALQTGDYKGAVTNLEWALTLEMPEGGNWDRAHTLYSLANAYQSTEDFGSAFSLYEQALELFRELGVGLGVAGSLRNLGQIAMQRSDYPQALQLFRAYLDHVQEMGNEYSTLICMAVVASLLVKCGAAEPAVELFSFVTLRCAEMNKALPDREGTLCEAALEESKRAISTQAWERAWTSGRTMSLERSFGLAGSELMKANRRMDTTGIETVQVRGRG